MAYYRTTLLTLICIFSLNSLWAQCDTHQVLFDTLKAGIEAKDPYLIAKIYHPEYRSEGGGDGSYAEDVIRALTETFSTLPDYHCTIQDVICTEDRLVYQWLVTGTIIGENTPIKGRGISILQIKDGLVIKELEVQEVLED